MFAMCLPKLFPSFLGTHKSTFSDPFAGRLDHCSISASFMESGKRDAKPFSLGQKFFLYLSPFSLGGTGPESGTRGLA